MFGSIRSAIALPAIATFLLGCQSSNDLNYPKKSSSQSITIYTVNYPLKYFADRIGGGHVNVVFPVPSDVDPAFWIPDAEAAAAYQDADLILLNGATYGKWVPNVSLPQSKLVDTTEAIRDRYITVTDAVTHVHGRGEEHSHQGIAFTTWLDPKIAIAQADAIRKALQERWPEHRNDFNENYMTLKSDLQALDAELNSAVGDLAGQPVFFSHPVFQYLTRRYELNSKSVHWEPDSLPSEGQWAEFGERLLRHPAKWMIWEDEPMNESRRRLSELGVVSVVFNPCGNTPKDGDWLVVMRRNAEGLAHIDARIE